MPPMSYPEVTMVQGLGTTSTKLDCHAGASTSTIPIVPCRSSFERERYRGEKGSEQRVTRKLRGGRALHTGKGMLPDWWSGPSASVAKVDDRMNALNQRPPKDGRITGLLLP